MILKEVHLPPIKLTRPESEISIIWDLESFEVEVLFDVLSLCSFIASQRITSFPIAEMPVYFYFSSDLNSLTRGLTPAHALRRLPL